MTIIARNTNATTDQISSGDVNIPVSCDKFGGLKVNIGDSHKFYRLYVPAQAVGANKKYFDLFNAVGSKKTIRLHSLTPVVVKSVAVTGTLGVDLYFNRTTDIGTGGTAATSEGTVNSAATFTKFDLSSENLPAGITARFTPSGGATAGAVLSACSLFTEETNSGAYNDALVDFVGRMKASIGQILIPENTGISVFQGGVTSVGNIGFDVIFSVE